MTFERDALAELFNVGLHRAAASLSEVTGQRIDVDMPKLVICPITEIETSLAELVGSEVAMIHQAFGGAVKGDAVLLLERESAAALTGLLTGGETSVGGRLDQSAREVLAEVANIVLGACLSGFGDMLETNVTISVPRIHIESLKTILGSLVVENGEAQYAVVAATQFRLSTTSVQGYLVVAIGARSLGLISAALAQRLT